MARSAVARKVTIDGLRDEIRRRFPHALFELRLVAPVRELSTSADGEMAGRHDRDLVPADPWRALLPEGCLERGMHLLIQGPLSSGKTSLALALLARATGRGERVAYVDMPGTFHPPAAEASGVALERLLLVRPRHFADALRACQILLECGGFSVVVLDVGGKRREEKRGAAGGSAALGLALRGAGGALVVLSAESRPLGIPPMVVLQVEGARPLWQGRGVGLAQRARLRGVGLAVRSRSRAGAEGPRVEVVFGG